MAEGWLCDSILKTAAQPWPISTAPAFSPGPCSTASPLEGSRRSNAFDDLYEQCSDHSTPSMPSSTAFGGRLSFSTMTRYSSGVRATSLSRRESTAATDGYLGERFGGQVVQMLDAAEHRSERIFRYVSEERTPLGSPCRRHGRQWAAWAPKIRRGRPAAAASPGSRDQHLHRLARDGAKQLEPVGPAKLRFGASLRVGHHAEHVAALVDDARDVVQGAVRVGAGHDATARIAIAKDHLAVLLESRQDRGFSEVAALAM